MMRHLKGMGDKLSIAIPADEDGFVGRECPNPECLGYFKIQPGTGLKGDKLPCHCPYCGHIGGSDTFFTKEQIEYAKSVAIKQITDALKRDMQEWDRELRRSTSNSFIKLSLDYKPGHHPVQYYREKQLETIVICDQCALRYAVYGVFASCPDCGSHNSRQILDKNIELVEKELQLTESMETQLAEHLVGDALENAVAAFDGFGRETCRVFAAKASSQAAAENLSFQNLPAARQRVIGLFGLDIQGGMAVDDWEFVCRCFQKRHLLAHKMGVVDQAYVDATHDPAVVLGRKIVIERSEVRKLAGLLRELGLALFNGLSGHTPVASP